MKLITYTSIAFFASAPIMAQDTLNLAREYVALPAMQTMIADMFSAQTMAASFASSMPEEIEIPEGKLLEIGQVMSYQMQELIPELMITMEENYAKTFSADELIALIDFYKSQHGAAILSKMALVTQESMASIMPKMMQVQQEMLPKILQILDMN